MSKKSYKGWDEKTRDERLNHQWSKYCELTSGIDHCTSEQCLRAVAAIPQVSKWLFIEHNNEAETHPHWHLICWFNKPLRNGTLLNYFDKATGRENSAMSNPVWHSIDAAVVYMLHESKSADSKPKYAVEDLVASDSIDNVPEFYNAALTRYNALQEALAEQVDLQPLEVRKRRYKALIASGELREYNRTDYLSDEEWIVDKGLIQQLLEYDLEKRKLHNHFSHMRIYWFSGNAGSRKTSTARFISDKMGYIPFVSGSGNDFLGDYKGQHVVILDDFRPENAAASTLLKLLDPHTRSSVDSRYHNKWLDADVVFITCPQTPEAWWQYHRQHGDEFSGDWAQLTRRINGGAYLFKDDGTIVVRYYTPNGKIQEQKETEIPADYYDWLKAQDKEIVKDVCADIFTFKSKTIGNSAKTPVSTAVNVPTMSIEEVRAKLGDETADSIQEMLDTNEFFAVPFPDTGGKE